MTNRTPKAIQKIEKIKIIYPIIFGVGVVFIMLARNFNVKIFTVIQFTWYSLFWIIVALSLMAVRDIGYMLRIKILTDNELTWRQAFRVIMLWEFTSAITPSAIGGTSVAILYVNKEGISIGKSSAVVMATSFLDEFYFLLMFPILLIISGDNLFNVGPSGNEIVGISFTNEFFYFAVVGYAVKFVYVCFLGYGLFFNPRGLKWLLLWIFKLPILRKWKQGANEAGSEIVVSSKELKRKPFLFWLKAFLATFISWTARYWVVNALFMAFFKVSNQFLIFGRQLVTWIMMLVSPTPGGSGFSEYIFIKYFGEFMPTTHALEQPTAAVMALFWRLISYYPYLIIGAIVVPKWIKQKFGSPKNQPDKKPV